ncbi:hypothetical protein Tco_1132171, partial [Tanacetum coccineum]
KTTIDQSADGKLRDQNAKKSWALLKDLAFYDNESWKNPRDFAKPVKAITLPQDVPSTSSHRLIELENQYKVNAGEGVNAANEEVSTAELVSTAYVIYLFAKDMDQESVHMVAASKVPILKHGEYELWRMRIEQYIQMINYALWEVIENGNTLPTTQVVDGVVTQVTITTVEDKAQRRLEVKAINTLMIGIPNEYQLKFNSIKDAKLLLEAIKKRFGGNAATKKTQRNLLK